MAALRKLALLLVATLLLVGYAPIEYVTTSTIDPDVLKYGGPPLVSEKLASEAELKSLHYRRGFALAGRVKREPEEDKERLGRALRPLAPRLFRKMFKG